MSRIAELKDKGAVAAWSPLRDHADVVALGSKVCVCAISRGEFVSSVIFFPGADSLFCFVAPRGPRPRRGVSRADLGGEWLGPRGRRRRVERRRAACERRRRRVCCWMESLDLGSGWGGGRGIGEVKHAPKWSEEGRRLLLAGRLWVVCVGRGGWRRRSVSIISFWIPEYYHPSWEPFFHLHWLYNQGHLDCPRCGGSYRPPTFL